MCKDVSLAGSFHHLRWSPSLSEGGYATRIIVVMCFFARTREKAVVVPQLNLWLLLNPRFRTSCALRVRLRQIPASAQNDASLRFGGWCSFRGRRYVGTERPHPPLRGPPSPTGEGNATLRFDIMISDSDPSGTSALEDDSRKGHFVHA